MSIQKTEFMGYEAIELSNNSFSAMIATGYGSNLVSLKELRSGIDILKTPKAEDYEEFLRAPQHFGNAVLFPPNRIDNGTYTKNNITYTFPCDDSPKANDGHFMYSHGILRFMPFSVEGITGHNDEIILETAYYSAPGGKIYQNFPHEFLCKMTFILSACGLKQTISFTNCGSLPMPLGVGFHTAFRLPNDPVSGRNDYRLIWSAGEHIELDSRSLPTGRFLPLMSDCRGEGILPFESIADEHTSAQPLAINKKSFHGAIIKNIKTNNNIYFEINDNFPFWMLWNNRSRSDYVCIEPMSWMINAPNSSLSDEKSGYRQLAPGKTWTASLYFTTSVLKENM